MDTTLSRPADTYHPLYFLASLGAGGIAVTFFMYLMFWVPHPGRPVPIFEDISAAFATGSAPLQVAIIVAVLGIAAFAILNLALLGWNLTRYQAWKTTPAFKALKQGNGEAALLALPLALAMWVNAMFIVGLVFVPGLWSVVEYLFPVAMVVFAAIGGLALVQIGTYLRRILATPGGFDFVANNSFAQATPGFALAMIAVGLAAPAAMSTVPATVAISLILSSFFSVMAIVIVTVAVLTGFVSILQNGVSREASPTLMIVVPILTVMGILALRQSHGAHTTFQAHPVAIDTALFLAQILAAQIVFLLLGMLVMRAQGYLADQVFGAGTSPMSFALVCPVVALSVMLHFFINKGLVGAGMIDKFGLLYITLTGVALLTQFVSIGLATRLGLHHFLRGFPQSARV